MIATEFKQTKQKEKFMNVLKMLLETDSKASAVASIVADELFSDRINPRCHGEQAVKDAVKGIKCVETAKKLAIKFDGQFDLVDMEDILCELMGDDAYFEFVEEHDLT
tara:strand:+ start:3538 stop:3861 length:324 start_codon:yes stop_codon:yes gene_type:complete